MDEMVVLPFSFEFIYCHLTCVSNNTDISKPRRTI